MIENKSNRAGGFFRKAWTAVKKFFVKAGRWLRKLFLSIGDFFSRLLKRSSKKDVSPVKERASHAPSGGDDTHTRVFDSAKLNKLEAATIGSAKVGKYFVSKKRKRSFILGTILTTAKVVGLAVVLLMAAGVGAVFGVANAYLGTTPALDLQEISDNDLTSFIYNCNGQLITTYAGLQNREYASLAEIPDLLEKAVVAIEDVRFYYHSGIDLKGLMRSFLDNASAGTSRGGSTITQQLVKNKLLTTEKSYKRKIQEASLALQLEKEYSKDEILEAYLNSIPLGGTIYGVKAAAKEYFGKELSELSLRECACIAGVTQYPWLYSPRRAYYVTKNAVKLNERIDIVLTRMYRAGYISKEEMDAAKADELEVLEASPSQTIYDYPHFVEYGIYDVVNHLLAKRELADTTANRAAIENELRTGGYHIYLTVDPAIQNTLQDTITNFDKYPKLSSKDSVVQKPNGDGTYTEIIQPQTAAVVLEQSTGNLKAIVGSRTIPTTKKSLNRAYQSRMPVGSSIKPIAVYGPAFDLGLGLGTIIENIPVPIKGWGTSAGYPTTSSKPYGPTPIRKAIVNSLNIVAARTLMEHVGIETSYNYLLKLGVDPKGINADPVGLALGTSGITVIEMAGAYATIANAGTYIEPLSFTKVVDSYDHTILDAEEVRDVHEVFKQSTAFMLVDALKNAVASGTGTAARISGITVAGKTGTNHSNRGIFFAGMTGYYVSTVWIGHDEYLPLPGAYGGSYAAPLWQRYMTLIHKDLKDKAILSGGAGSYGVTTYTVCAVSGKIPTEYCTQTYSDYFAKGHGPSGTCDMCVPVTTCSVSGSLVGKYCPAEYHVVGRGIVIPEKSLYAKLDPAVLKEMFPNLVSVADPTTETDPNYTPCPFHTYEWALEQERITTAKLNAQAMISEVNLFINKYAGVLTEDQVHTLQSLITALQNQMKAANPSADAITSATSALSNAKKNLQDYIDSLPVTTEPTTSPTTTPSP